MKRLSYKRAGNRPFGILIVKSKKLLNGILLVYHLTQFSLPLMELNLTANMHWFYTCLFISASIITYSQDCSKKSIKAAKKEFNKKNTSFSRKATIAFNMAMCYQTKNDSVYRYWLQETIENNKQDYGHPKQIAVRINKLYQTGFAYYELKDYKASETYLAKAIRANQGSIPSVLDSTVYLYYGVSLFNNKDYHGATETLTIYKKSQPADTLADSYLKKCIENK